MPEQIDGDKLRAAFDKWSSLAGVGAGENALLDLYANVCYNELLQAIMNDAQNHGMEVLPADLREQYERLAPSQESTSKMIARDRVARILAKSSEPETQCYVRANAVDTDYPADSTEMLPCVVFRRADQSVSVGLLDGAYSGSWFIVPADAVTEVTVSGKGLF